MESIFLILVGISLNVCPASKVTQLKQTLPCLALPFILGLPLCPVLCQQCCLYSHTVNHIRKLIQLKCNFFLGYFSAGSIPPYKPQLNQHSTGEHWHKMQKNHSLTLCISKSLDNNSITPSRVAAQMKLNWDEPLNTLGNPAFSFRHIPYHFRPAQESAVTHHKPMRKLTQA